MQIKTIGFIGAGAMGRAIITGILKAKIVTPEQVWASDIDPLQTKNLKNSLGINTTDNNLSLVKNCNIIVLAVKPYLLGTVLEQTYSAFDTTKIAISVAAGIKTIQMEELLPKEVPVVRVMPNTPCLVGEGANAIAAGSYATDTVMDLAKNIFSAVGTVEIVKEELLDVVTGLSGSGPAYVYTIIEGLIDGAVRMGLPRNVATNLAVQTIYGAAKLVKETGEHPAKLRDLSTTPGGTTMAGLYALEAGNLRATLMNAVKDATVRSTELSEKK